MTTTMHKDVVNGQVVWWQTSCRTEHDWYVITYGGVILADHLPTQDAAEAAGCDLIARARDDGSTIAM